LDDSTTFSNRTSRRRDLEQTATELVSSVMDADWESGPAATRVLRRARGDRNVLMLLRARVAQRLVGRPTPIDQRIAATLDDALRQQDTGTLIPRQQGAAEG